MQNRKEYYPFFFYLKNSTKYFLIIKRAKRLEVTIVRPGETISIQCMDIDDGKVEISILENAKMRCSFFLQNGYTVEIKDKVLWVKKHTLSENQKHDEVVITKPCFWNIYNKRERR